jgi:hypothetical protein
MCGLDDAETPMLFAIGFTFCSRWWLHRSGARDRSVDISLHDTYYVVAHFITCWSPVAVRVRRHRYFAETDRPHVRRRWAMAFLTSFIFTHHVLSDDFWPAGMPPLPDYAPAHRPNVVASIGAFGRSSQLLLLIAF